MSSWIFLAIGAQILLAVVTFVDRHVLTGQSGIGKPIAYALYVSLLSGFVIVLVPFGLVSAPSLIVLELSLVAAVSFVASLYLLYTSLKEGHASDVMPVVAAVSALTSFAFASEWLNERLPPHFLLAACLFVAGTLLISRFRFTRRQIAHVVGAGFFFGVNAFLFKFIFEHANFVDGFFWTRMMDVVVAIALLAVPSARDAVFHGAKRSSHGTKWLVVGNKALAGAATALTLFAISKGSVSIVNAMSGLQFGFLLLIAYLFVARYPAMLKGEIEKKGLTHKLWGVALIMFGIASLYVA